MNQEIKTKPKVEEQPVVQKKLRFKIERKDLKKFMLGFVVGVVVCLGLIAFVLLRVVG